MRELDHPNVVNFVEIFVSKSEIFLIMEYYSGKTFKELIKEKPEISEYHLK